MKRYIKNLLTIVLALGLVLSLCACKKEDPKKAVEEYVNRNGELTQDRWDGNRADETWQGVSVDADDCTVVFTYTFTAEKSKSITDKEALKKQLEDNFNKGITDANGNNPNPDMLEKLFTAMQNDCKYIDGIQFVYRTADGSISCTVSYNGDKPIIVE